MKNLVLNLFSQLFELTPGEIFRSRQARGLTGSLFLRVGERALRFIMAVLLARFMGPEQFGTYVYILSWVVILVMPGVLGTPQFASREIAIEKTQRNWPVARGLIIWSSVTVLIASGAVTIFAWYLLPLVISKNHSMFGVFQVAVLLVPILSLMRLWQGAVRGWGDIILGQLPDAIVRPAIFVLAILVTRWLAPGWLKGPEHVFLLLLMSTTITMVFSAILVRIRIGHVWDVDAEFFPGEWLRRSSRFTLLSGLSILNARIGIVLLGLLAGPREVALFMVALRGAELISVPTIAGTMALSPRIASLIQEGKLVRLRQMIRGGFRGIALLAFPGYLLFVFAGEYLLQIFGEGYDLALGSLVILVTAHFSSVLLGPAGTVLNMGRWESLTMVGAIVSILISAITGVLLIPRLGVDGMALGTGLGMFMWNLVMVVLCKRKLDVWTPLFGDRFSDGRVPVAGESP